MMERIFAMALQVGAIVLIVWLVLDTLTRGRLNAVAKGTGKGAGRTAVRAGKTGARRARDNHRAYLESGKAPLGRTRAATGRGVRAVAGGARDGVREELAKLRTEVARAREAAEGARAAAQDPARGIERGRFGHSFDLTPRTPADPKGTTPEEGAVCTQCGQRSSWGIRPDGAFICQDCAAKSNAPNTRPASQVSDPDHVTNPPSRDNTPGALFLEPADPTDPSSTTTEGNPMSAMTTGTGNGHRSAAGGGGGGMHAESLPEFIAGIEMLARQASELSEAGTALGVGPAAQAGLTDAIDALRSVAQNVRTQFQPLIEAADATHVDAAGLTVGAARSQ